MPVRGRQAVQDRRDDHLDRRPRAAPFDALLPRVSDPRRYRPGRRRQVSVRASIALEP